MIPFVLSDFIIELPDELLANPHTIVQQVLSEQHPSHIGNP
jgi:hypothetical protein